MHVSPQERAEIERILQFYVPQFEVRAFGSRVTAEHLKPLSDLDLVIMNPPELPIHILSKVKDAFTLSDIPYRVDVLDAKYISEEFRKIIDQKFEVVQHRNITA